MINNRQGGSGRRRGRGGQRNQNVGGPAGNRQDNRQRGNAAQLLEKYKNMARDAQLAGDRVQTEYYLQYADHYFRVLGESRARYEDQNPRRQRDDDFDDEDGDEEMAEAGEEQGSGEEERPQRDRQERFNRQPRGERRPRYADDRSGERNDETAPQAAQANGAGETIPFDVLPPAIGRDEGDSADGDDEPRPVRRRARRPRPAEGDGEVAPAA